MTKAELTALDQLRGEVAELKNGLHAYHVEVKTIITRCESCRAEVAKQSIDLYGSPQNRESSPGVLETVQDLCRSRRLMIYAMRGAWGLLIVLIGAITAAVARKVFLVS